MISIKKLCKSYGSLEVLKDLDLDLYEGEILVILGASGVGKSVLLRQILGIEPPDSGCIQVDGKKISEMSSSQLIDIRKQMGMLFQSAALFDSMTVGENVAFYLMQHEPNLSKKDIQKKVAEALAMVNMTGSEDKMPSDLSGGMRKRTALARVIVYKPRMILYDEPTTGLDPITAMQINKMIVDIQNELPGRTSIVVTHDIKSTMEIADRIAFFNDKKIAFIDTKEKFINIQDPKIRAFFDNASITKEYLADIMKGNS